MPRSLWNGAITFGLVHIPVALYPASHENSIDFDWLDKRSMDPVGYKRVNKRTGREIDKAQIVRGIRHEQGEYVVLSDDEIRAACPKTTQTIEIESFVDAQEIPFVHFERPYKLAPSCAHCGCRILGHGIQADTAIYCCAHCARESGVGRAVDNTTLT
jgi:DNA end-binding protein Ku